MSLYHPSTPSHLATEHALLTALARSAQDQHRAQPFMRRLAEVVRLTGLLRLALQHPADSHARLAKLVPRFEAAVVTATRHTEQIIELHHFLPLQVMLLAIYARLFTLATDLQRVYGDGRDRERPPHPPPPAPLPIMDSDMVDMDTVGVPVVLVQTPAVALDQTPSPAVAPPEPARAARRPAPTPDERPKKKKKAKDEMDDIFGMF